MTILLDNGASKRKTHAALLSFADETKMADDRANVGLTIIDFPLTQTNQWYAHSGRLYFLTIFYYDSLEQATTAGYRLYKDKNVKRAMYIWFPS